jgi:hypothetical protein
VARDATSGSLARRAPRTQVLGVRVPFGAVGALVCVAAMLGGCKANDDDAPPDAVPMVLAGARDASDPAVVAITRIDRRTGSTSLCTGTLVAPRFVLTAAHCVNGVEDGDARLGVSFRASRLSGSFHTVPSANVHLPSRPERSQNDIALVELAAPSDVAPLPVNFDADAIDEVRDLRIVGYGLTGAGRHDSGQKRVGEAQVARTTSHFLITSPGRGNSCFGDSGGPALARVDGRETVVGVTSFGIGSSCRGGSGFVRTDSQRAFLARWLDAPAAPPSPRAAPTLPPNPPVATRPPDAPGCTIWSAGGVHIRVCT